MRQGASPASTPPVLYSRLPSPACGRWPSRAPYPNGEGVAGSLPLRYGTQRPWVHSVNAEVILHLLRHADHKRTTGVPARAAKAVNQMPLKWLQDGLRLCEEHTEHRFWFARATSEHSSTLLHKADWAASGDTVLQNTPSGPDHAQLIVASSDGKPELQPPAMQMLGTVAQQAQLGQVLTHGEHTP